MSSLRRVCPPSTFEFREGNALPQTCVRRSAGDRPLVVGGSTNEALVDMLDGSISNESNQKEIHLTSGKLSIISFISTSYPTSALLVRPPTTSEPSLRCMAQVCEWLR